MNFRFNGGRGAILCSKCGKILAEGSEIPESVWKAVREGRVKDLPNAYCEDNCEASMKALASFKMKKLEKPNDKNTD